MLPSLRDEFDIPREVCYLNAAAWSPLPRVSVAEGEVAAARKGRPWELPGNFDEEQFARARAAAAAMINADAADIALISSVGYGVSSAAKILDLPAGSRIVVLEQDHTSPVLEWLARAEDAGFELDTVSPGEDRDWTAAVLEAIDRPGARPPALVSISNVHWSDGGLIDLDQIQAALKPKGGLLLVDATHAAGVLDLDVTRLDPDFIVFPTYKWLIGPYGRAFLYVAKRHQDGVPLEQTSYGRKRVLATDPQYFTDLDYAEGARRFDMGERDFWVSLPVASTSMELLLSWGLQPVRERMAMLTRRLDQGLAERQLPVATLREDLRTPNILSLGFPQGMPEGLADRLADHGVYAAARLGRLRISPHVYNDEEDCDRCVAALAQVLR